MGYAARVKREIRKAFNRVGDLAKPVTLLKKNTAEFDFGNKEVIETTLTTTTTKAVFLGNKRAKDNENPSIIGEFLLSAEDISDLDIYDRIVMDGVTWTLQPPYENDGYLITVKAVREAT
jgi:hypothetical protein